jgi:predicted RNA-binding protein with EMAP domain
MAHDTSRDPRLLVGEIALKRLNKLLPLRHGAQPKLGKQETSAELKRIESNLMACKFMYLAPDDLAGQGPLLEVVASARKLRESLEDALARKEVNPMVRADLRWCFRVLEGLTDRLRRPASTLAAGVDLLAVKVKQLTKKDKLWVTRVDAGDSELTVVTNMEGIAPGQVLAAALLPPVELAGTVSEAMYLGKESCAAPPGTLLADDAVDAREAASILHEEASR